MRSLNNIVYWKLLHSNYWKVRIQLVSIHSFKQCKCKNLQLRHLGSRLTWRIECSFCALASTQAWVRGPKITTGYSRSGSRQSHYRNGRSAITATVCSTQNDGVSMDGDVCRTKREGQSQHLPPRLPLPVPSVTSTDGRLTVPSTPGDGKKPHQRRRPRAERTTTRKWQIGYVTEKVGCGTRSTHFIHH